MPLPSIVNLKQWAKSVTIRNYGLKRRVVRELNGSVVTTIDPFEVMASLLGNDRQGLLLDVGANVGQTVTAFRSHFPHAEIHAFEPSRPAWEELNEAHGADPLVVLHRFGAAAAPGSATLHTISTNPSMNSILDPGNKSINEYDGVETIELRRLDNLADELQWSSVDVLKMDVEGFEDQALLGASGALSRSLFKLIFLEVGFVQRWEQAPLFGDIESLLGAHDYQLYDLFDLKHFPNGQLRRADALFLSSPFRAALNQ